MKVSRLLHSLGVIAVGGMASASFGADGAWISVPDAPVHVGPVRDGSRAADGTSWFARSFKNPGEIASAKWTVAGLGVFEVFVNGERVGSDFLKPGFTHYAKTKYSFSYDVTGLLKRGKGEENVLAAEVSAGWWRDKIVTPSHKNADGGFSGSKSAFLGRLEIVYADGRREEICTGTDGWRCGVAGSVTHAAIFDGEEYDARVKDPVLGEGLAEKPEINTEFKGEVLPSSGAEVTLRRDLAMVRGPFSLKKGETLVVDFGQNCAAVPEFRFSAKRGAVLTALPAEMLNDADKGKRGCDGPKGSVYRENLRVPNEGMRAVYTFAGEGRETYLPRFTFFGYRYISLSATEDVEIESVASIPVTSIKKEMELGTIETGDKDLNRFIKNVYWGQLSNYLSVPTDCPQRNERLGWSADTQVFCEAGAFNADTRGFFRKFTRDLRDSQSKDGGYPSVAPFAQYGNEVFSLGWADVGVIVPWTIWRQFGDESIVRDNWAAMSKFVRKLDETKYDFEGKLGYIYADWLSYEKFETCGNTYGSWKKWKDDPDAKEYRRFLAACYWLYDARLMAEMGEATGQSDAGWFRDSASRALAYIRGRFLEKDGLLLKPMRELQTACVFAIKLGIVEGDAKKATKDLLVKSIREHGDCLQTGFLGTAFIMDALTECGADDVAYTLLLQHKNPSWLYSVDQGATTVWERWNSYTKKDGFGPVGMNSFNHYAYGAVLAWIYRSAAGIAADSSAPGFRRIVMAPKPDRRLGFVKAEYKSAAGLVKSAWRYEGDEWVWEFTVPEGATARVTVPGETSVKDYPAGTYAIRRKMPGGFCRVEKGDDGRWWIVGPDGRRMFLRGVDHANWNGHFCEALGVNPYREEMKKKFATQADWEKETLGRLKEWGFNALGAGCSPELRRRGLLHIEFLGVGERFCMKGGEHEIGVFERIPGTAFPNVFHPDFPAFCDERAAQVCAPQKNDSSILGYFFDNELAWFVRGAASTGMYDTVARMPKTHSARKALDAFLAERGVADAATVVPEDVKTGFLRLAAQRYFGTIAAAIRRYDPNHLLLGCRFAGLGSAHQVVWEEAGRVCDILTFNNYPWADLDENVVYWTRSNGIKVTDAYAERYAWAKKPMIITEWSFPALDSGLPCSGGAGQRFRTQAERVQATELFARTLLALPFMVGYDYFMWVDEPALGISLKFPEDSNYGLVNGKGEPYAELTAMFARINREAEALHGRGEMPAAKAVDAAAKSRAAVFPSENARPGADAAKAAFSRDGDAYTLATPSGLVLKGRVGGRSAFDSVSVGGLECGSFTFMVFHGGYQDIERVESAEWLPASGTLRVTGAGRSGKKAFRVTCDIVPFVSKPWFAGNVVSVENFGEEEFSDVKVFMRQYAPWYGDSAKKGGYKAPTNVWKAPSSAVWLRSGDGAWCGAATYSPAVQHFVYWVTAGGAPHPDAVFSPSGSTRLAAGARWTPEGRAWMVAAAGKGGTDGWRGFLDEFAATQSGGVDFSAR